MTARSEDALVNCVRELEAFGAQALAVPADHAAEDEVHQVVERTLERFGRIDTVVASAFVSVFAELEQLGIEELRRVLDVNFLARIYLLQASLPHLQETRGHLRRRQLGARVSRHSAPGALLRHEGGAEDVSRVRPRRAAQARDRRRHLHFDRARQKLGFQPEPVPPIYQPEPFAEAVLHCAEHPIRALPIGWGAQKLLWGQKLSPRLGDLLLVRNGWKSQHMGEPKPTGSPDNLFEPLPGDPGARGRFDDRARASTLWTSIRLRRRLVGGAVAAAGGLYAAVSQRNGHRPQDVRRLVRR